MLIAHCPLRIAHCATRCTHLSATADTIRKLFHTKHLLNEILDNVRPGNSTLAVQRASLRVLAHLCVNGMVIGRPGLHVRCIARVLLTLLHVSLYIRRLHAGVLFVTHPVDSTAQQR
jgi:hypothetical protein